MNKQEVGVAEQAERLEERLFDSFGAVVRQEKATANRHQSQHGREYQGVAYRRFPPCGAAPTAETIADQGPGHGAQMKTLPCVACRHVVAEEHAIHQRHGGRIAERPAQHGQEQTAERLLPHGHEHQAPPRSGGPRPGSIRGSSSGRPTAPPAAAKRCKPTATWYRSSPSACRSSSAAPATGRPDRRPGAPDGILEEHHQAETNVNIQGNTHRTILARKKPASGPTGIPDRSMRSNPWPSILPPRKARQGPVEDEVG